MAVNRKDGYRGELNLLIGLAFGEKRIFRLMKEFFIFDLNYFIVKYFIAFYKYIDHVRKASIWK